MTELQNLTYHQLARYIFFPDRESLGIGWKIDLEVLMDLHVLRPQARSPKMWFLKNVARTLYSVDVTVRRDFSNHDTKIKFGT